jgi:hypothetical protein
LDRTFFFLSSTEQIKFKDSPASTFIVVGRSPFLFLGPTTIP